MFGFSLTKILLTILLVVAAWRLFGLLGRVQSTLPAAPTPKKPAAIDVRPCPRCGDYVAAEQSCPRCRGSA